MSWFKRANPVNEDDFNEQQQWEAMNAWYERRKRQMEQDRLDEEAMEEELENERKYHPQTGKLLSPKQKKHYTKDDVWESRDVPQPLDWSKRKGTPPDPLDPKKTGYLDLGFSHRAGDKIWVYNPNTGMIITRNIEDVIQTHRDAKEYNHSKQFPELMTWNWRGRYDAGHNAVSCVYPPHPSSGQNPKYPKLMPYKKIEQLLKRTFPGAKVMYFNDDQPTMDKGQLLPRSPFPQQNQPAQPPAQPAQPAAPAAPAAQPEPTPAPKGKGKSWPARIRDKFKL
jgi:hypothetical protein